MATAKMMRSVRKKSGLSVRKAALLIKVSAPFLSDMELGRRNWTPERVNQLSGVYASKMLDDIEQGKREAAK